MAELTGSAKRVIDDYDAWSKFSLPYRRKWFKYWQQWNNKRINRQYKAKVADSIDPMAHQMIEARVDNIYGSRPRPAYIPTQPEQEKDTKLLTGMFQYSWNKSDMDAEIIPIGREVEITGNTIIFTGWADGYMTMTPIPIEDCVGDTTAKKPSQVKRIGYRRLVELDSLKDEMEFDPTAGDKDEDGNTQGKWVKKYKLPKKIVTWGGMEDSDEFDRKKIYAGSTLPDEQKDKQGEVVRMNYFDKTIEVLNRKYVIYEKDNLYQADEREVEVQEHSEDAEPMYDEQSLPEWAQNMPPEELQANKDKLAAEMKPAPKKIKAAAIAPFLPFAMGRNFVDGSVLLAKGTMETISEAIEDLNDEINIKKDNLIYRQQNNALVDRDQAGKLIPLLAKASAGANIPAEGISEGKIPVHQLEKPELGTETDVEINRIKQSIRDTARVAEMVQGIDSVQKKTATEVNAQVGGANAGFKTQNGNLRSGLYNMLGEQFYKMVQIFMTREQIVRVMGPDGVEFKKFDPNKYFGEYDCVVSLEDEAKAAEAAQADRALKAFDLFKDDPDFNQIELKKKTLQTVFDANEEEIKLLMNPDPANGATQGGIPTGDIAEGAGAAGAVPPEVPSPIAVQGPGGNMHESADLVKLFALTTGRPEVQNQILQSLGFDPGEAPPLDAVAKAQEIDHKEANMAMTADKHQKEMTAPVEPPKVAA